MIHSLLWWLDPVRVQAVCAVLGVIGLFIYAWDNRRSANYSREQIEEPSIPFVTIDVPTMSAGAKLCHSAPRERSAAAE
jgi:hypothetical protein